MHIRARSEADIDACVALMHKTHRQDGYPRFWWPDPAGFLVADAETGAWVAEVDGVVVGHVALHSAAGNPVLGAGQRRTGLPAEQLTVLARLLVSTDHRRSGVGRQLLIAAVEQAHARRQRPLLDVIREDYGPIRLYESLGWERLEPLTLPLDNGHELEMWVYLGPEPTNELN
jgi:GNAT superfamily N-acetyltransferase